MEYREIVDKVLLSGDPRKIEQNSLPLTSKYLMDIAEQILQPAYKHKVSQLLRRAAIVSLDYIYHESKKDEAVRSLVFAQPRNPIDLHEIVRLFVFAKPEAYKFRIYVNLQTEERRREWYKTDGFCRYYTSIPSCEPPYTIGLYDGIEVWNVPNDISEDEIKIIELK